MSVGAPRDFSTMPEGSQPILAEIQQVFGFIPPALGAVAKDPASLRGAWLITRAGYLDNPLPPLFKERFMAVMAKYNQKPYSLIVRSCSLRRMGMTGQQILEFLRTKLPPQLLIAEQLRTRSAKWVLRSGWESMPHEMEPWVLWASARVAVRKDPGGRCRDALNGALGDELFNRIVALSTFAAMQRVWIDAHPDVDPTGDARVQEQCQTLLSEAPEFSELWSSFARRAGRRPASSRERRLLAEIARQDRAREKLRESERRFRRVVHSAAFPVMIYAQDGEVVMMNKAWTVLSGWTRKTIPNMQTWMKTAEVDETDWSPQDLEALDGWDEVIEEGEQSIRTRSGQIRKWDFSTAALGELADGRRAFMRMATDVTERRELETVLRTANQRMAGVLESITDAFVALDRDHRLTWMNSKAADMLNVDREAVLGKMLEEALPAAANTHITGQIFRCIEDGKTRHLEYHSDVVQAPIEMHIYGWPGGASVFFRDVGERKRMEQQLRAREQYFRSVFECNMVGMLLANISTGAVIDCNDTLLAMLGYTREDLREGRFNWIAATPPEWSAITKVGRERVRHGPLDPYEKEYLHKDGHPVPVMVGGTPVVPGEDLAIGFVIDRTTAQQARKRGAELSDLLEAVVRSIPSAVLICDLSGRVIHANQAATDMFGWTLDEIVGKPVPLVPKAKWPAFDAQLRRVVAGERLVLNGVPCLARSNAVKHCDLDVLPVKGKDGSVVAIMGIVRPGTQDAPDAQA